MRLFQFSLLILTFGCATPAPPMPAAAPADPKPKAPVGIVPKSKGPDLATREDAAKFLEKGLGAVQEGQFGVASRYFFEAWKADPMSTQAIFNLGLSHAKAGREINAIPWLETYLALAPVAENGAAVRQELQRLEAAVEAKIAKVAASGIAAYNKLDAQSRSSSFFHRPASVGLIDEAVQLSGKGEQVRSLCLSKYVSELVTHGLAAAAPRIREIQDETKRGELLWRLVEDLIRSGRSAAAARLIPELPEQFKYSVTMTKAFRFAWDKDLPAVEELMPQLTADHQTLLLVSRAEELAEKGDPENALRELARVTRPELQADAVVAIALQFLRQGKTAEAKSLVREKLLPAIAKASDFQKPSLRISSALLLGNYDGALADIGKHELLRGISYGNDKGGKHYWYGLGILIAGLQGQADVVQKFETAFKRRQPPEEEGYKRFAGNWTEWGHAMTRVWKGDPEQAIPYFHKIHFKLQDDVLPELVEACLKLGKVDAAERAVWVIPEANCDVIPYTDYDGYLRVQSAELLQARVTALIRIAEDPAAVAEAPRLLRAALRVARRGPGLHVTDAKLLDRLAAAQDKCGDAEGAAETRAHRLSDPQRLWMQKGVDLKPLDLEIRLKDALKDKKPAEVPDAILEVAKKLHSELTVMRKLRELAAESPH